MKKILLKAVDYIDNKTGLNDLYTGKNTRYLSRQNIRLIIWIKITVKLFLWVFALYLIVHFSIYLKGVFSG